MHILIADDDVVTRKVLTSSLRKWDHEVVETCNGNQAWDIIRGPDAPHLVLLDWMMPGIDGVEVCNRLRKLEKDICPYVILLTGMSEKKDLLKGFDAGADDYIVKPFDRDELNVRIRAGERIIKLQLESLLARDALRKLATYDYLTGLRNRASILNELRRECERAPRTDVPVTVVMADVDHFKQINDTYGHSFGDKVLAEVAKRIVSEVRSYEAVGRYGGEEFLIVLTGCDASGAKNLAERVRHAIEARPFCLQGRRIGLTLSLGIASSWQVEHPTPELLIEMADVAMYSAKRAGRNRVELAKSAHLQIPMFPMDEDGLYGKRLSVV